jgi:hypothetical protein
VLNKNISLKAFREGDIQSHFWTPLSIEASEQRDRLQQLLELIQMNPTEADHWTCIWNSGEYVSQKAYLQIIGMADASLIFNWM